MGTELKNNKYKMNPSAPQGISLQGKTAEELGNLLLVAQAQLAVAEAQPALIAANAKVATDNANKAIATQETNIANIQSAITALTAPQA